MSAKIIVFCNQKGGAGKTTGALNVAGSLGRRGFNVEVVDGDEQGSLVEISALAPEEEPFPASVSNLWKAGRKIHQEVKKKMDSYDFVIVDCPPAANSPIAQSMFQVADLAVITFIPGSIDALAAPKIRDAIESAWITNPEMKTCILLSRVEEGWNVTKEIITVIEKLGFPVFKSRLTKKAAYVESPIIGNSVHALKAKKAKREKVEPAIQEVENLTDEILKLLEGG